MNAVRVTIAYLARVRECTGVTEEVLELTKPAFLQSLWITVLANHPELGEIKKLVQPLVNGRWVGEETELKDGDRVALVPPVGGG